MRLILHKSVYSCPLHQFLIRGMGVPKRRPMHRFPAMTTEHGTPQGRRIHIDKNFHEAIMGKSASSTRQAA